MDLKQRQEELASRLQEIHADCAGMDRELEMLRNQREELAETEAEWLQAKERLEREECQAERLKKTGHFLKEAKASFTAKYSNPILKNFQKYYQSLTGEPGQDYELDANTHLTKQEAGMQREIGSLSTGYQDLIGFCMRMAIADAMHPAEKPFLILDDPLIHLDEKKLEKAMSILKQIAEEYQIIYFTCHKSRQDSLKEW